MIKKIIGAAIAISLIGASLQSMAENDEYLKQNKPELKTMTVSGTVSARTVTRKDQEIKVYTLTDADGNEINLPTSKPNKKNPDAPDLAKFEGKDVTMNVQGIEKKNKDGSTLIHIRKINSIKDNDDSDDDDSDDNNDDDDSSNDNDDWDIE